MLNMTTQTNKFREGLHSSIQTFIEKENQKYPKQDMLSIDLHCHDAQSDVFDELLGRILRWPETWVSTDGVIRTLEQRALGAITITNHNNARSCWNLLNQGYDVVPAAEFTCSIPDVDIQIHVLTYGFSPDQEAVLNRKRKNLYAFLEYTLEHQIVTVLAHPLYFYTRTSVPSIEMLERLTLLFERFEGINGQRDTWQNALVVSWIQSLNEEKIESLSKKIGISPGRFCTNPYKKVLTGGSDDHMALFTGMTGTRIHVPDLELKLKTHPASALALDGLRKGEIVPFGSWCGEEKLPSAFLDYFCQAVLYAEDPGLIRLLLHQGTTTQKIWAYLIANAVFEIRRHRYTRRFVKASHEALRGRKVSFFQRLGLSKDFRPLARELEAIAHARNSQGDLFQKTVSSSIPRIFHELNKILAKRITKNLENVLPSPTSTQSPIRCATEFIERLELPVDLRALFGGLGEEQKKTEGISHIDLMSFADGLPFPALAASVIGSSAYMSSRVLFTSRPLLNSVAKRVHKHIHPKRVLWLTDTFFDKNGVAHTARLWHQECVEQNLPIDFATCHENAENQPHLHILRPTAILEIPQYPDQKLRVFDLIDLQNLFLAGGYDRILCSTELLMGMAALHLKSCYTVPAHFYMHTDWLDFSKRTLGFDEKYQDRLRRLLRQLYRAFDGVFVLNEEHANWLASPVMGISKNQIHRTAHWIAPEFKPQGIPKSEVFQGVHDGDPILLFAGRVSKEKGIMEFLNS